MNFFERLAVFFSCPNELEGVKKARDTFESYADKMRELANTTKDELEKQKLLNLHQIAENIKLQGLLEEFEYEASEDELATYYNDRYEKNNLKYPAYKNDKGKTIFRDPRTYFSPNSHILEAVNLKGETEEETVLNVLKHVISRLSYLSDKGEMWKTPEQTYQEKYGDCEDGALLIVQLCLLNGVAPYRIKVYAGWTKENDDSEKVGHAWAGYRRRIDDEIVAIDWCYFPNKFPINKRVPMKEQSIYLNAQQIWFSFNNEHTWSPKEIVIVTRVKQ